MEEVAAQAVGQAVEQAAGPAVAAQAVGQAAEQVAEQVAGPAAADQAAEPMVEEAVDRVEAADRAADLRPHCLNPARREAVRAQAAIYLNHQYIESVRDG